MSILHTALLILSLAGLQFFQDTLATFGILLIAWGFFFWYYMLDLYSHVLLLAHTQHKQHTHILPLPRRLLHQMQKKHHFQVSTKSVNLWDNTLFTWLILGTLLLVLSYTQNAVFKHYNINLETEELITMFLQDHGINRAELETFSLIERLMPIIFYTIIGMSFLTTLMRSGVHQVNSGMYGFFMIIFVLQVFLMLKTGFQFIHMEWVMVGLSHIDLLLMLMGALILFEFVKSFIKQQISTSAFLCSVLVLLVLGFFTFFEYGPVYPHALYYNGWILLAIGWGRQNKRTRKRIVLRQV